MKTKRVTLGFLSVVLFGSLVSQSTTSIAQSETGSLRVTVIDPSGNPIPFRAWVTQNGKRLYQPSTPATTTPYRRDESFSCDGWFEMNVSPGEATVHVEKGKEWLPQEVVTQIQKGETSELNITLGQWIDMAARHYYSSDLHIHFGHDNLKTLHQLGAADDLDVVPSFTYWLRGTEERWHAQWPTWAPQSLDHQKNGPLITRNNLEIERISSREKPGGSIGASFLFNLQTPVSVNRFDTRYPTDTDLCLLARASSPGVVIDTDKPSWAETVVGAILGAYDTVQVCHNHYHRQQTIPGGWGMIGPLSDHERELSVQNELFHRTNQHYYAFLNCGLKLAVSGGSAIGVMPVPTGYNRVYANVSPPMTLQRFWQAIRKGNSFATSGPMLFFKVDSKTPGNHIHYQTDRDSGLTLEAEFHSIQALDSLEIIHNGKVIETVALSHLSPSPTMTKVHRFNHIPNRSGWYAARLLFESPTGHLRQAHTSPVYLTVDRRPTAFKRDATYLIQWIDQLQEIAEEPNRYRTPSDRREVLNTYQRARDAYQRISELAGLHWND